MANAVIGAGFDEWVQNQIDTRQRINGTFNKTPDILKYQNNNNAFLRLTSGIDVNEDNGAMARQYQLYSTRFGGEFAVGVGLGGNTAYGWESNTGYGYVPPPGILSADIKSQNRGSLKEATINMICHNKPQFDILSKLYLRIGYSMLLEWGWGSFFHNDQPLTDGDTRMGQFRKVWSDLDNDFLSGKVYNMPITQELVQKKIQEVRKDNCGNFDAIYGRVVNYSWSLEKDGSYTISLILKTWGDVTESLKANVSLPADPSTESTSLSSNASDQPPLKLNQTKSTLNKILWSFTKEFSPADKDDYVRDGYATLAKNISTKIGVKFSQENNEPNSKADLMSMAMPELNKIQVDNAAYKNEYYVRLGCLLRCMQNFILLYNSDTKNTSILDIDYDPENNFMFTFPRHCSLDPRKCLIEIDTEVKSSLNDGKKYIVTTSTYVWYTFEIDAENATDFGSVEVYTPGVSEVFYGVEEAIFGDENGYYTVDYAPSNDDRAYYDSVITNLKDLMLNKQPNVVTISQISATADNTDSVKKAYTSTSFDPIETLNAFASKTGMGDGDLFQDEYIDKEGDLSLTDISSVELGKEYLTSYDKVIEETVSPSWLAGETFGIDQNVKTTVIIRKHEAQTVKITDKLSNYSPNNNLPPVTEGAVDVQNRTFEKLKDVQNYRVQNYGYIGRTMNIMVNINFVAEILANYIDPKTSSISVFDFLDNLMTGIQEALGSVNSFNVIYNEDKNTTKIIDSTYIPQLNEYKPELFSGRKTGEFITHTLDPGKGSFVRDASIKTKLSNNFASMTTIGAQANGNVVGENSTALSKWNTGLTDRILKYKTTEANPPSGSSIIDSYASNINKLQLLNSRIDDGNITAEIIDSCRGGITDLFKFEIGQFDIPGIGFLPIDLELTMDGLSGIKIYETYTADTRLLPDDYKNKIQFITTGVSHKIQNNDWTTTISSVTSPKYEGVSITNPSPVTFSSSTPGAGGGTSNGGCSTKYPNLPILDTYDPTYLPYAEAKKTLVKLFGTYQNLPKNIFVLLAAEAAKENASFRSAGHHNYAGVQTDNAQWPGSNFTGQFCRVDSGNVSRMFAAFTNNEDFLKFLGNRLNSKGFSSVSNAQQWAQKYLNSWVFFNLEAQDKAKYDSLLPFKINIYNTWSKTWDKL